MNNLIENQNIDFSSGDTLGGITSLEDLVTNATPSSFTEEAPNEIIEESNLIEIEAPVENPVIISEVTTEIKVEAPIVEGRGETTYKSVIEQLVTAGIWEAVDVIETEDGEVEFKDAEISKELFDELSKYQGDLKKEKLLTDKVDINGVSDFTKKLIEIEKAGGDVKQAISYYENLKDPLSQLDITSEQGQEEAVRMHLKATKMADDMISLVIKGYKNEGVLEAKAEESTSILNKAFDDYLNSLETEAVKRTEKRAEDLKAYKTNLKTVLKDKNVGEVIQKRIIDAATREEGNKFEVDTLYNKMRVDPKESAELTFFLLDREKYLEYKFNDSKIKSGIDTLTKFKFTKKAGDSTSFKSETNSGNSKGETSLDELTSK